MNAVEQILAQTLELAESDRATIAARLLEGLPGPDCDVSDKEVAERKRQLDSGEVEDISFDELKVGLDL